MSQEVQQSGRPGQSSLTGTIKIILANIDSQQFLPIKYNQKAALGLGIIQIILGVICIISNIVILATTNSIFPSAVGHGFWGGILFAVAGLVEVLSARKTPNLRLIFGSMTLSVVAAFVSAIVFCLGIVDAVFQTSYVPAHFYAMSSDSVAFAIILTISALAEIVISIIGSAICCGAFCREYSSSIPISVQVDGNQLVLGSQPTNSCYQSLVKPPN